MNIKALKADMDIKNTAMDSAKKFVKDAVNVMKAVKAAKDVKKALKTTADIQKALKAVMGIKQAAVGVKQAAMGVKQAAPDLVKATFLLVYSLFLEYSIIWSISLLLPIAATNMLLFAASSSLHRGCGRDGTPFRNLRNDNPVYINLGD